MLQTLLAEVALQRGKKDFAGQAYADLALRTRDPGVFARDRGVDQLRQALRSGPRTRAPVGAGRAELKRAQQVLLGVLVMSNQLDGLAPQLIRMLEADPQALPTNLMALNRMFARSQDRRGIMQLISKVCAPFLTLPEAHYAIAVAAAAAGDNTRALAEIRRALEMRPDWEVAALLEAQLLGQKSPARPLLLCSASSNVTRRRARCGYTWRARWSPRSATARPRVSLNSC